jgi:hypothetical protein
MVNYSNGKVYRLVSFSCEDVYYGSTCSPLSKRLAGHKSHYKRWRDGKFRYMSSFEIMKYPDTEIILVESVNCASKEELHAAERKYIEANKCSNKTIPGRSEREYYQDNKHEKIKYQNNYYQDNKARLAEKVECECGYNYTYSHTARHKHSKRHLKYLLSIADTDTEHSSSSSEYVYDGVKHAKIASL